MSETKETEQNDWDEKGNFLPGNQYWQLNAFKEGNIGRPNKWTPEQAIEIMADYLQARLDDKKPITKAGLRLKLGISAEALDNYSKGEYGKSEEEKQAYVNIFMQFNNVIEDELETELRRNTGQVSGIIFALKNQFHNTWKDEKYLSVDTNERRTIKIICDPNSELGKRLSQDGASELIEHEAEN